MGEKVKSFEDLRVWNDGMQLVEKVYSLCASFPKEEIYGLVSQLKRCSVSVPSNIAEGQARNSTKEYIRFLFIAKGSLAEMQTQIMVAQRLGFVKDTNEIMALCKSLSIGLSNLISSLRKKA